jgi:uncharacterized protein (TIGR02284 family)
MAHNDGQSSASSEARDEGMAEALRALNALCHDSEAGYRKAAEDADKEDLKFEFEELAEQRAKMAEALDKILRELGIEPAAAGTLAGSAHRAFLDLRSKLQRGNPKAVFAEIARGEGTFESAIDKALEFPMPQNLRRQLQGHHRTIRQARDYYTALARRMRSLHGGSRLAPVRQFGSRIGQHPLTAVAVVAASALALGAIAQLSHRERPSSRLLDLRRMRNIDPRELRKIERRAHRGLGNIDPRDLRKIERRAHRGLEKLTKHFGGYR